METTQAKKLSAPWPVRLSAAELAFLDFLAQTWGTTKMSALRRAIRDAAKHEVQNKMSLTDEADKT